MAIQVGGVTVIDNSQNLTSSVGGLKTVGGNSLLGSGDISIASGLQFEATLSKAFSNLQYGNGYFVMLDQTTNPYTVYYSSNGTSWSSYTLPSAASNTYYTNKLRWYEAAQKWILFSSRHMYIASNPTSSGNWTYRALYSGWGGVQGIGYVWGSGVNTGSRTDGRFIAGHGWTGSYGTWGISYSDNQGSTWYGGGSQSMGNFGYGHYSGYNTNQVVVGGFQIQNPLGSPTFNPSYSGPQQDSNAFVKTINSSTDLAFGSDYYFYHVSNSNGYQVQSSMSVPSGTNKVVWDSANSQYIAIATNYIYTSPTGEYWAANFSPTGGATVNAMATGGGNLVVCGNGATFTTTL